MDRSQRHLSDEMAAPMETSPVTQNMHPASQNMHPATQNMHPATQNMHPATQNMHPATQNMQNSTSTDLNSSTPTQNHVEEIPMMVLAQETPRNDGGTDETMPKWRKCFSECNDVDRQWSWAVLGICFVMFILGNGAQFAFGVMYSSIRRYFNTSKATTSWILLLQRGTGSVFGKGYVQRCIFIHSKKKGYQNGVPGVLLLQMAPFSHRGTLFSFIIMTWDSTPKGTILRTVK